MKEESFSLNWTYKKTWKLVLNDTEYQVFTVYDKAKGNAVCSKEEPGAYWGSLDYLGMQGARYLKCKSWINSVNDIICTDGVQAPHQTSL